MMSTIVVGVSAGNETRGTIEESKRYDYSENRSITMLKSQGYIYFLDRYAEKPVFQLGEWEEGDGKRSQEGLSKGTKSNESKHSAGSSPLITRKWNEQESRGSEKDDKPRTVRQHKNKRRRKELEKEHERNERWKRPSSDQESITGKHWVTLIPLSYDERAVDCAGLRSGEENGTGSIFRPLSQIFDWNHKGKSDTPHRSHGTAQSLHKFKSEPNISTEQWRIEDRVTLFGKGDLKEKKHSRPSIHFTESEEAEQAEYGERVGPKAMEKIFGHHLTSKRADSGYQSPEMTQRKTDDDNTDQSTQRTTCERSDRKIQNYDLFDSSKATLFNQYFGENDEEKADEEITGKFLDQYVENFTQKPRKFGPEGIDSVSDRQNSVSQSSEQLEDGNVECTSLKNKADPLIPVDFPIVVAIDFGTSYCGYAYGIRGQVHKVHMMRRTGSSDRGSMSPRYPTCLLLESDGQLHSFGMEAVDAYQDMEPEVARHYLFFAHFKTLLHDWKCLNHKTTVPSMNGVHRPFLDIVSHCLGYIRQQALSELSDLIEPIVDPSQIQWVITVPAIWDQAAKQFMRLAAYQAGVADPSNQHQLIIALEAEAVALCFKQNEILTASPSVTPPSTTKWKGPQDDLLKLEPGTAYIVADCGGGKVDIVVQKMEENGEIVELTRATGGVNGSTEIDRAFECFLRELFTPECMEQFRIQFPAAYLELLSSFDTQKRSSYPLRNNSFNIPLPLSFMELYKKTFGHRVECAVNRSDKKQYVTWNSQGTLRLSTDLMCSFFMPTLFEITCMIEEAIKAANPQPISYLILVGGFAQSLPLQHEIRNAFEDRMKVLIRDQSSTAVLCGAVHYGLNPKFISCRRTRYTYGISVLHPFDPLRHPLVKKVSKDGRHWCKDVFEKFVTANQLLPHDHEIVRHYCPADSDQSDMRVLMYCTQCTDPVFVTDPGVRRCAVMKIDLPLDQETGTTRNSEIKVIMKFGGSELIVEAIDLTSGLPVTSCIDFFSPAMLL